jgi:hypothetical protein
MNHRAQFAALAVLLALAASSSAQQRPASSGEQQSIVQVLILDGEPVGTPVASRAGEICMLCDKPVSESDITYLVHGQRVPVHRIVCDGCLRENPRAVLASLQPRGAFLGAEKETPSLSGGWFVFGAYVLLGLFFGALCAHRALGTGRGAVMWFLIGFATSIVGFAVLRSLPSRAVSAPAGIPAGLAKIAATRAPAVCPACGSELHPSATVCSACGAALRPNVASEVTLAMRPN